MIQNGTNFLIMHYKIYFLLLLFFNLGISQNILISYHVSENTNNPVLSRNIDYNLIIKKQQSIYYNTTDSLEQFKYSNFIDSSKKIGDIEIVKLGDNVSAQIRNDLFYKNYIKDSLTYNEAITNKKIIIGENISLLNWEILPNENKTILNYPCNKATAKFRGRIYEAYFTDKIANYGGPWKFDGLPGLILSVKSLDNYYSIEASKIIINKNDEIISDPYLKDKKISWLDFKNRFKEYIGKTFKLLKSMSENGEGGSIKITDKIEDLEIPEMKF